MKRSFALCVAVGAVLVVAGCGAPPDASGGAEAATDGWIAGPQVQRVIRSGGSIVVSGTGAPFGRVVLTGADGVAYAAGADEQGQFDVRLPAPSRDALMAVEAQVGQIAYPAAERLLVAADRRGPVALLGIGAPTRRLDAAGPLDSVDTDGRATFVSGRATPGSDVQVVSNGAGPVRAGADGRWSMLVSGDAGGAVQVAGRTFVMPSMTPTGSDNLERAGAGWRIGWGSQQDGRQVTWFPDP